MTPKSTSNGTFATGGNGHVVFREAFRLIFTCQTAQRFVSRTTDSARYGNFRNVIMYVQHNLAGAYSA